MKNIRRLSFLIILGIVFSHGLCAMFNKRMRTGLLEDSAEGEMSPKRTQNGHLEDSAEFSSCSNNSFGGLLSIIARNDSNSVSERIQCDASLLERIDSIEDTLLHWAVRLNKPECLQVLIDHGADRDACNEEGLMPLHVAIELGFISCAQTLIESGANLEAKTEAGCTSLHLAALHNKPDCIELLIAKDANQSARNEDDQMALHVAVQNGYVECVQCLLTIGEALVIDVPDGESCTPLHLAALYNKLDCLELLIAKGANRAACENSGLTPLHLAVRHGYVKSVRLLLTGSGRDVIDMTDEDGCTALHFAAMYNKPACIELLVDHNAQLEIKDDYGYTPLHCAAHYGHERCVRLLVDNGANKEAWNDEGLTALHIVSQNGHADCVQLLIQYGASMEAIEEEDSPLHLAAINDYPECARHLINNGATINEAIAAGCFTCVQTFLALCQPADHAIIPLRVAIGDSQIVSVTPRLEEMILPKEYRRSKKRAALFFHVPDISKKTWDRIVEHTDDLFVLTEVKKQKALTGEALEKFNDLAATFARSSLEEIKEILRAANYLKLDMLVRVAQKALLSRLEN